MNRITRLAVVLLAAALSPAVLAVSATATPVPVPESAPVLPAGDELQAQLEKLQGFLEHADTHIRTFHAATEQYREYVLQVQQTLATCEVQAALDAAGNHPFAGLLAAEHTQCQAQVVTFKAQARDYALQLDEWAALARLVEQAADSAQRQQERIRHMQHARRLKQQVDEGLNALQASKDLLNPWMD